MAGVFTVFNVVAVALAAVIIYFLIRIRVMMRNAPGARKDMNAIELFKNWQAQKAAEAEHQNELKARAKEEARPEIERALIDKYKKDEIAKATADPKDRFKTTLRDGLGIDADKVFSEEKINRITGRSNVDLNTGVRSESVFSKEKLSQMSQTTSLGPDRIRSAAGDLNWKDGVKSSLQSEMKFGGLREAIRRPEPEPPKRVVKFR